MSTRTERDKSKSQIEKHLMILSQLLKDEDNKYCVDCDAKGPRWASWNLGIFLCIRCAGIHRNLGVHISKVKSVNLDSWTAEQIAMVQEMGNSRARAVYEANLPDNFRRPQTDSGLEAFVRAKYEMKKYIAQEWIPPQPKLRLSHEEIGSPKQERKAPVEDTSKKEKKKSRPRSNAAVQLSNVPAANKSTTQKAEGKPVAAVTESKPTPPAASIDLLGLDTPAVPSSNHAPSTDPFGDFISVTPATNGEVAPPKPGESSASSDLQDMGLFSESTAGPADKQKQTKDNIMALFGSGTAGGGSQMFNVPGGVYMQAQQPGAQQQMWGGAAPAQNGMMPTSQANMGVQGNMGMMGVPQGSNVMAGGMQHATQQQCDQTNLMAVETRSDPQTSLYQQAAYTTQPTTALDHTPLQQQQPQMQQAQLQQQQAQLQQAQLQQHQAQMHQAQMQQHQAQFQHAQMLQAQMQKSPEQSSTENNPFLQSEQTSSLMVVDPVTQSQSNFYHHRSAQLPMNTPNLQGAGMMYDPVWSNYGNQAAYGCQALNMMPNMMGQMGAGQQAAMMQQTAMMQNMYNTNGGVYNVPQQMQQVQNQMGAISLGGAGVQQPGMVAAGGGNGATWATQNSGQTLHNNLWQ